MEIATFEWVSWWNEVRLHQSLGYRPPSQGGNRILEADPATGNNRNQGKCLGTKPGALQSSSLQQPLESKRYDYARRFFLTPERNCQCWLPPSSLLLWPL
ncbi:hypothetical protein GWO53_01610 [Corynebacterium macginleyi]|uniref:Integrase catalytic domain-containing protein n=2 Tax=Corynebacterium macginleyi TaxID=38290 RepID=A0A3M0FX33_9CORY|nr:hypothetical protein [Corynebacterium macginleyi]MBK4157627.1 hypothetical protein [Corynebacterium macginleyi]MBK4162084.1 hypothetical protein [Corynebacterium macginleyi]MBK4162730.1 hypothetical protein [Corynebacterium macginleyi]MBK4166378.1 hypothetical protein [Corynebacterium macginleyi]